MVLLGGMFLGHMRLLTQTAASQPPWISGTATSRWTSRATTSVRYDTDAGCESAPHRRSLTSIFRHAFPPRPDSTLRRRRGANPCSMGDRRDLGLGRNQRPVSENCSEALTGNSWPSALIRAPCGVRVISDAVTHRTAAVCEPVANAGQLGQHLNAPAGAGRLGCRWQALARVGAG